MFLWNSSAVRFWSVILFQWERRQNGPAAHFCSVLFSWRLILGPRHGRGYLWVVRGQHTSVMCQWMVHWILKWAKLVLVFSWWQPLPDPVTKPAPQQNKSVVWAENIDVLSFMNHRVVCNLLYFEHPEVHCHTCCSLTSAVTELIKKSAHHHLKSCFGSCDACLASLRSLVVRWLVSSVQSFSHVQLFVTLWTAAHQASVSITNSQSLLKLMCIELVMPSTYLILCHPLLLLPSVFPSIRIFPNESVLHIRWP